MNAFKVIQMMIGKATRGKVVCLDVRNDTESSEDS